MRIFETSISANLNSKQALIFIDMDNFKIINDTMGHFYGDNLIIEASKRLSDLLQNRYSLYRLGGDEFIVYFKNYENIDEVEDCADKITTAFRNVFNIAGGTLNCTVSIGIALYSGEVLSPDELLKCADIAMFKAKEAGKNNFVFYNKEMQEAVKQRMLIEKYLRTALQNGEFDLNYQPQLDVKTNKISGFEALLRWDSPQLGSVPPNSFICIAEETQLIILIGEWVLKKSCIFLKELQRKGYKDLTISVNISVLQLLQGNFVERVLEILEEVGLNPQKLELEITESIFIESYEELISKLKRLREEGIKIAMDDFGKGYSSLSGLKQMPINTLKIDKTFIDSICSEKNENSITESIVMMGRRMGMTVLAEGVETNDQMEYLTKHKCHKIQGYIVSRPVPQREVVDLMEKWG